MPAKLANRIIVVTGTDTGVGKTWVSRGLLRAVVHRGGQVVPVKIVETGCAVEPTGELLPADGLALAHAAHWNKHQLSLIAPLRFRLPAAPPVAARAEGHSLDLPTMLAHIDRARSLATRMLVEGAGGLLTPLTATESYADLASALDAPIVLVSRDALGTLNHTFLALECAANRGIAVAAVVLNAPSAQAPDPQLDHAAEIRRRYPNVPIVGPLGYIPDATDDALAHAVESAGLLTALATWVAE